MEGAIHFPRAEQDEMFCSVMTRLVIVEQDHRAVARLRSMRVSEINADLPHDLRRTVAALPPELGLDVNAIIDRHTIFPYLSPFIPPERAQRTRARMCSGASFAIFFMTGLVASRLRLPPFLRVCPKCLACELTHGLGWWHRAHQLPGVLVCHRHGIPLIETRVARYGRDQRHYIPPPPAAAGRPLIPDRLLPDGAIALIRFVANESAGLLAVPRFGPGPEALRLALLIGLRQAGFLRKGGKVNWPALIGALREKYGAGWSLIFEGDSNPFAWLTPMLRAGSCAKQPLRHLVMLHFLGWNVDRLLAEAVAPGPVVPRRPRRHGRRRRQHKRFMRNRAMLSRLWSDHDFTVSHIARLLGIHHGSVLRWAEMAGLPFPRPGKWGPVGRSKKGSRWRPLDIERNECRSAWLQLLKEGSQAPTTTNPRLYSWLRRNDHAWLRSHRPPRKRRAVYDWHARDRKCLRLVQTAAAQIIGAMPPIRASQTRILVRAGILASFGRARGRLPDTIGALQRLVELPAAFAARKVSLNKI